MEQIWLGLRLSQTSRNVQLNCTVYSRRMPIDKCAYHYCQCIEHAQYSPSIFFVFQQWSCAFALHRSFKAVPQWHALHYQGHIHSLFFLSPLPLQADQSAYWTPCNFRWVHSSIRFYLNSCPGLSCPSAVMRWPLGMFDEFGCLR